MDTLALINKWLHLISIVGVLGGTAFAWLVMSPAGPNRSDTEEVFRPLWRRFGIAVAVLWVIVLLTGFINLYLVSPKVNSGYQMLLGIKMALSIAMFIVTMVMAHPIPALARIFEGRRMWLAVLSLVGIVILGLSAHLNISRISGAGLRSPGASTSGQADR